MWFSCIHIAGLLLITELLPAVSGFGCENDNVHFDCGQTSYIYVTEALYGRRQEDKDLCEPGLTEFTTCSAAKATETVRSRCNYKRICDIMASNDVFGDPCTGHIKYLDPTWYCVKAPPATYKGCFWAEDFNMFSIESDEMSVERCLAHCRSYTYQEYAGLRRGRYCACASGAMFNGFGKEKEETCEDHGEPCSGNKEQICGSDTFTSVYRLDEDNIRLVGSRYLASNEGRIEIERYGFWHTICGHGFDIYDADVACRMVGYLGAEEYYTAEEKFGEGYGDILLSGLECSGQEGSLLDCPHDGLYETDTCTHAGDMGVVCRQWTAVEMEGSNEDSEGWLSFIVIDIIIFVMVIGFILIVRRRQVMLMRRLRRRVGFCEALCSCKTPESRNHDRVSQGSHRVNRAVPARPATNRYGGQQATVGGAYPVQNAGLNPTNHPIISQPMSLTNPTIRLQPPRRLKIQLGSQYPPGVYLPTHEIFPPTIQVPHQQTIQLDSHSARDVCQPIVH